MEVREKNPPRKFVVGAQGQIEMSDCAEIELAHDEQVTFRTEDGKEYDVARKDWGFYATPSLNGRLNTFGLRGVLIKNRVSLRYFVLLVEEGKENLFQDYCEIENLVVITWLDTDEALSALEEVSRS